MTPPHLEPDPYRLAVAAHELGHAIVWRAVGFDIDEIWVKGHGPAAHGHVWIVQNEDHIRTLTDEHGVQTGLLAGREAQIRWCAETGPADADTSADQDMTLYRRRRRTRLGRRVSRTAVRADARRLVRDHWHAITRLAPVLATTGHLAPRRLPARRASLTSHAPDNQGAA